jgi:hypothetical protein
MIAPPMLLPVLSLSLAFAAAAPTSVASPSSSDASTGASAPSTAQPSASASDRIPVALTIVNRLAGEDAASTEAAVRLTITTQLQGRDFEVGASGESQLEVVIERDEAHDGIRMQYRARAAGKAPMTHSNVCERCGSDELAAALAADLDAVSPALTPALAVPAPVVTPSTSPQDDTMRARAGQRIGPLGVVGAAVGGAGLGVLIAGAVLAAVGDSSRVDPNNPQQLEITRRRTPGLILLGTGAGAVAIGAVLLGVDLGRRAKAKRRGAVAMQVARHMSFGAGGIGLRW